MAELARGSVAVIVPTPDGTRTHPIKIAYYIPFCRASALGNIDSSQPGGSVSSKNLVRNGSLSVHPPRCGLRLGSKFWEITGK